MRQTAEKAFKAVLTYSGVDFPPTHNLAVLRDLLPAALFVPRNIEDTTGLIEEVRAARQKISEECGHDMHKLFERQKAAFAEWKGKKITVPFHPEWRPPNPSAAIVAEDGAEYARKNDAAGKT